MISRTSICSLVPPLEVRTVNGPYVFAASPTPATTLARAEMFPKSSVCSSLLLGPPSPGKNAGSRAAVNHDNFSTLQNTSYPFPFV